MSTVLLATVCATYSPKTGTLRRMTSATITAAGGPASPFWAFAFSPLHAAPATSARGRAIRPAHGYPPAAPAVASGARRDADARRQQRQQEPHRSRPPETLHCPEYCTGQVHGLADLSSACRRPPGSLLCHAGGGEALDAARMALEGPADRPIELVDALVDLLSRGD